MRGFSLCLIRGTCPALDRPHWIGFQTDLGGIVPIYWAQNPEPGVVNNFTPSTLYIPPFVETAPYTGSATWNDKPVVLTAGTYALVFGSQVFEGDTLSELFMGLIAVTA